MLDSLCKGTRLADSQKLFELVKASLKKCANSAMILVNLIKICSRCVETATSELNIAYKHLSFLQGEHPKLFFIDSFPRSIKEITETNGAGQCLSKKNFQSSPSGSNISLNSL